MNAIKETLAIPAASYGLTHYWKGRYKKGLKWLQRGYTWGPSIVKGTIFEAYLGLSLYKINDAETAIKHLKSAKEGLTKIASANPDIHCAENEALIKINEILNDNDT